MDINNTAKYINYGFNEFNYMLAKGLFEYYEKDLISKEEKIKELNDIIDKQNMYVKEQNKLINYISFTAKEECGLLCNDIIDLFFKENNLKSEDKKKQIIKYLLFENEKDKIEVTRYIQRFAINKSENIFDIILNKKGKEIKDICDTIKKYQNKNCEYDKLIYDLRVLIFEDIIPNNEYISFPLKDTYIYNNTFNDLGDNCLYINIEFSNHGKRQMNDDYPCILKVDYSYNKNNKIINNDYFIKSEFDAFFKNKDEYYINKSVYNIYKFDPFSIWKYSERHDYNTISTSMEYYNGINEFTLKDKEKYRFADIINEIDNLIDEDTKIIYNSGCKKLIKCYEDMESTVIKKIIKLIKY